MSEAKDTAAEAVCFGCRHQQEINPRRAIEREVCNNCGGKDIAIVPAHRPDEVGEDEREVFPDVQRRCLSCGKTFTASVVTSHMRCSECRSPTPEPSGDETCTCVGESQVDAEPGRHHSPKCPMWREGGVEPSGDGEARKLLRGYEGAYQTLMRVESEHGSDDRWNAANKRYQRARKEILARLERHGEVVAEGWNGKETDHIHRHAVWLTELCSDLVLGGEHGWTTLDREEFRRFRERVGKHLGDESRAVEAVLWDDDVGGDPRDLAREIVRLRKEIEHLRGRGANRNESG